jgi:hypothetical protein
MKLNEWSNERLSDRTGEILCYCSWEHTPKSLPTKACGHSVNDTFKDSFTAAEVHNTNNIQNYIYIYTHTHVYIVQCLGTWPLLTTSCTVFGYLRSRSDWYFVLLQSQPHVTTITIIYYAFARLHNYNPYTPMLHSICHRLHNTLQIKASIHTLHLLHIRTFRNDLLPRTALYRRWPSG